MRSTPRTKRPARNEDPWLVRDLLTLASESPKGIRAVRDREIDSQDPSSNIRPQVSNSLPSHRQFYDNKLILVAVQLHLG